MTAIFSLQNAWPHDYPGQIDASGKGSDGKKDGDGFDDDLSIITGGVITIGNFDGVHRGHVRLLEHVRSLADQLGGPAIAIVLDPHPASILRPEFAPKRLTDIQTRAELMDRIGIDALVVCQINRHFLNLSAEAFFASLVQNRLNAKAMVEGPNFFFGRDRGGNVDVLAALCGSANIQLNIVEPMEFGSQMISSTRIRGLLAEGAVAEAAELLGHPHRVSGTVCRGEQRGRDIGFPTANLSDLEVVIPSPGVYAGNLNIRDETYIAAIHIGPNPTFDLDGGDFKVEVHALDYDGDLYGQRVQVDFLHRIRDVVRFESPDALVKQLHLDIAEIRRIVFS